MNANELADELTELIVSPTPVDDKWACELIDQAATMLRQQQAEIEALKSELDRAVELYTDKAIENGALHRFIDERGETGQLIIWKAQEK